MNVANWPLRHRITALAVAAAAVLGLIAVAAGVTTAANRTHVDRLADRLSPAVIASEQLLTIAVNQESGVRGYALGGQENDLTQYHEGVAAEAVVRAELARFLAGEPAVRRLDDVTARLATWRGEVAEPVIAAVRASGPASVRADPRLSDESRFSAITQAIADLQAEIGRLREEARTAARDSGNALILLILGAGGTVLFAGTALALLLRRLVTQPVAELAAEVRLVASGEYDRPITEAGPPELARLARDVDVMRQRISADLAEVRRGRLALEDANQRLESQAEELMRSNRDLEQFAYVASHDLQEPLRKVASFCQLLQRRYAGQLDEKADQYIAFAVAGAQRMQRLINDLLSFSRIGRMTTGSVDVDLNGVVEEAVSQLDNQRDRTGARVTWDELPVVRGEEQLLIRLMVNLVGNALKFAREDGLPEVRLSVRKDGAEWEFACTDNGIGIEAEFADKVFVIFQRLHPRDAYPGTGIGLAIAKKIVEYHGGRIWVDTDYHDGAAIRFTLPIATEDQAASEEVVS